MSYFEDMPAFPINAPRALAVLAIAEGEINHLFSEEYIDGEGREALLYTAVKNFKALQDTLFGNRVFSVQASGMYVPSVRGPQPWNSPCQLVGEHVNMLVWPNGAEGTADTDPLVVMRFHHNGGHNGIKTATDCFLPLVFIDDLVEEQHPANWRQLSAANN